MSETVHVTLDLLNEDPERGLWCPVCHDASAVRFHLASYVEGALVGVAMLTLCVTCEWFDDPRRQAA